MMHLHPELVRTDQLQDQPFGTPLVEFRYDGPIHYVRPWHLHVPMAGGGDTREATPEKGRLDIEASSAHLADFLAELSALPWSPTFPYPAEQGEPG